MVNITAYSIPDFFLCMLKKIYKCVNEDTYSGASLYIHLMKVNATAFTWKNF